MEEKIEAVVSNENVESIDSLKKDIDSLNSELKKMVEEKDMWYNYYKKENENVKKLEKRLAIISNVLKSWEE